MQRTEFTDDDGIRHELVQVSDDTRAIVDYRHDTSGQQIATLEIKDGKMKIIRGDRHEGEGEEVDEYFAPPPINVSVTVNANTGATWLDDAAKALWSAIFKM